MEQLQIEVRRREKCHTRSDPASVVATLMSYNMQDILLLTIIYMLYLMYIYIYVVCYFIYMCIYMYIHNVYMYTYLYMCIYVIYCIY